MESAQVLKIIRSRINGSTQRQVAQDLGVSTAYLSDVLAGKRNPGKKILDALGLKQRIVYSKEEA